MSEHLSLPPQSPAALVVDELRDRLDPARPPMLVGAEARDILHDHLGHSFANKATEDVDLAFALPDWDAYRELVAGFERIPDTGIAFRVAQLHVDFMAFGSVESPQGTVRPPFREAFPLDVFGMTEVYAAAHTASTVGGPVIRVPTVAGYVALKIKAWIDRSAVHNQKDAPDLGLALFWAAESAAFQDRFWNDLDLFGAWEADASLGGAALLGADVRDVLGAESADRLADLFTPTSRAELAGAMPDSPGLILGDVDRRAARLEALVSGLRG